MNNYLLAIVGSGLLFLVAKKYNEKGIDLLDKAIEFGGNQIQKKLGV